MKNNKGITLIALIITIIVMLILVAVTITTAINGGLFEQAKKAAQDTEAKKAEENALASGRIKIGDTWYDSPQDYVDEKPSADQTDTNGGGSETPEEPSTGNTYAWEKYSINITYVLPDVGNKDTEFYPEIIWQNSYPYPTNRLSESIVRYGKATFNIGDNTIVLSDEWNGNYREWLEGQYKNYPFGAIEAGSYCISCYNCSTCSYESIVSNKPGIISFQAYNNTNDLGTATYKVYPQGLTIQAISKGSYKYGEVVSSDSTTYPTDGFKDGCWYVYKGEQ